MRAEIGTWYRNFMTNVTLQVPSVADRKHADCAAHSDAAHDQRDGSTQRRHQVGDESFIASAAAVAAE